MKQQIHLPPKLVPVFSGKARYRGAFGGRGSAKTRSFALMTAIKAYQYAEMGISGVILCGREFMNSLEDSSMEEIKQAIQSEDWLNNYFDIGEKYIRTKNRKISYIFTGLRHNLDSLKSKARILIAWIDEAENVSEKAWSKLTPTVREDDSEIWVTWNPEEKGSPTDKRFRQTPHEKIVQLNYTDNPFFPKVLEKERLADRERLDDATYRWVWDGDYLESSDAQIFKDKFIIREFEPNPSLWDGAYFGLDFGFANDPTAGSKSWVFDGDLYIEYDFSQIGLEIDDTAIVVKDNLPDVEKHDLIADNARPESISYLKRHGLPKTKPCEKGKGSVEDGIAYLKSFKKIIIHPRCMATAQEFRLYQYKVDRLSGEILPQIVDANNHIIDSLRYAHERNMKRGVGRKPLYATAGTTTY